MNISEVRRTVKRLSAKWRATLAALLVCFALLAPPARAAEFNRACSVTGGSAQQLSTVLSACGYSGVVSLDELTLKNPSAAANTLYIGQSDVDATNGYEVEAGGSATRRTGSVPIQSERIYLFVATTQNVMVSLRSK